MELITLVQTIYEADFITALAVAVVPMAEVLQQHCGKLLTAIPLFTLLAWMFIRLINLCVQVMAQNQFHIKDQAQLYMVLKMLEQQQLPPFMTASLCILQTEHLLASC